jgi:hypothetical protein
MKGASEEPSAEARRTFLCARSDAMGIWILLKIVFILFLPGIKEFFFQTSGINPESGQLDRSRRQTWTVCPSDRL